jgi:hypothetical protein
VAAGGISATELASDAVTTIKILNDAVTTAKIADNQITNGKMADNSVDSAEIVAGAVDPSHLSQKRTYDTYQATTSGTAKDFTGIPSWATRVVVVFSNVSLSGNDDILVQIGDIDAGLETSGYSSTCSNTFGSGSSTTGFLVKLTNAAFAFSGTVTLDELSANLWTATVCGGSASASYGAIVGGGTKALSDILDRVRVSVTAGSFDTGGVNIFYE